MKYVSYIHVTVKQREGEGKIRALFFMIMRWIYKGSKVSIAMEQKGDKITFAKAMFGRDTQVAGRAGKVITVELIYPWDKLFLAIVRYRGEIRRKSEGVRVPTVEEINRYGK